MITLFGANTPESSKICQKLVYPFVLLVCPLAVLVCPLIVLACPLVVSICPLVVLVVLSVGLFITDHRDQ